jgi:hypothetical protein
MAIARITQFVQFFWMFESHAQQRLMWADAAEARIARARAEERAAAQLQAMLDANPSGSLGHSKLDDEDALREAGLL